MWCYEKQIRKTKTGKLISPSEGAGILDTVGDMALDGFINHGVPWLAKKGVDMGRYVAAEAIKNPKLQKKAIDFALDKLNPMIQNVGSQAMNELSDKIRPKGYKKGGALARKRGPTAVDKAAYIMSNFVTPAPSFTGLAKILAGHAFKGIKDNVDYYKGGAVDIHKAIGKLPKPKGGWTLPGHKYTGPYNDLDSQVKYDPVTGEILEIYDKPTGKTDAIAMQHDVDYSVCKDDRKCKNKADRWSLDNVPYDERQWGHWLARNMINTKQKLGLGVKQRKTKNVKSRRVRKTGKKN